MSASTIMPFASKAREIEAAQHQRQLVDGVEGLLACSRTKMAWRER
jgi:hypothetical protein